MCSCNRLLGLLFLACFIFVNRGIGPPLCFSRLWKSVQVTEPLDQHQKIRHLAQKTAYTILLKVTTSIPPFKKANTGMNDRAAAPWWSNRRMTFPSPNLQKRHGSSGAVVAPDYSTAWWCWFRRIFVSAGNAGLLKGSGGLKKKEKKENWNLHSLFFLSPPPPPFNPPSAPTPPPPSPSLPLLLLM